MPTTTWAPPEKFGIALAVDALETEALDLVGHLGDRRHPHRHLGIDASREQLLGRRRRARSSASMQTPWKAAMRRE